MPLSPADRAEVVRHALEAAGELVAAGRLREAQDEYIQVLLLAPDNREGWAGLVRVRRLLARDDPAKLLAQAARYRRAIARGEETEEHYTIPAMRVLAQASERAAQGLEQARKAVPKPSVSPIVLGATPRPAPRPAGTPTVRAVRPPVRAAAPTRRPTLRATIRSTSRPPATPNPTPRSEPLFVGRTGPIATFPEANEVQWALTWAGYAAYLTAFPGTPAYQINFGPYPQTVTAAILRLLGSRFPGLAVAVTPAP